MKSDMLIKHALQNPKLETELTWYVQFYNVSYVHPWDHYASELYKDFRIHLPLNIDSQTKDFIIGLAILAHQIKLEKGDTPGTYRIYIKEIGYLDEIRDVLQFCVDSAIVIIIHYYKCAHGKENIAPEQALQKRKLDWNGSRYVVQEKIKAYADKYSMGEVARYNGVPEDYVPQILSDYYSRINREKLDNLNCFLEKAENLFKENKGLEQTASLFKFFIQEVQNGGVNIHSSKDVLPHYTNLKFN